MHPGILQKKNGVEGAEEEGLEMFKGAIRRLAIVIARKVFHKGTRLISQLTMGVEVHNLTGRLHTPVLKTFSPHLTH